MSINLNVSFSVTDHFEVRQIKLKSNRPKQFQPVTFRIWYMFIKWQIPETAPTDFIDIYESVFFKLPLLWALYSLLDQNNHLSNQCPILLIIWKNAKFYEFIILSHSYLRHFNETIYAVNFIRLGHSRFLRFVTVDMSWPRAM